MNIRSDSPTLASLLDRDSLEGLGCKNGIQMVAGFSYGSEVGLFLFADHQGGEIPFYPEAFFVHLFLFESNHLG